MTDDKVMLSQQFITGVESLIARAMDDAVEIVNLWYGSVDEQLRDLANQIKTAAPLAGQTRVPLLDRIDDAVCSFPDPSRTLSRNHLRSSAMNTLIRSAALMNADVGLPVEPAQFIKHSDDQFSMRIKKSLGSFTLSLKNFRERVRALFRFPPRPAMRHFDGLRFVRIYFTLPFEQVLLDEWNRLNRTTSDIIVSINRYLDETAKETPETVPGSADPITAAITEMENHRQQIALRLAPHISRLADTVRTRLATAGTILLPAGLFSPARVRRIHRQAGRQFIQNRTSWRDHWYGVFMDLHKDLDLIRLIDTITLRREQLTSTIKGGLEDKVIYQISEIRTLLTSMKEDATRTDTASRAAVRTFLIDERKLFTGEAAERYLTPISDLIISFDLAGTVNTLRNDIEAAAALLKERYAIFTMSDDRSLIPDSELEMVPLRELFLHYFKSETKEMLELALNDARTELVALSNEPVVLGEIVESTFDTAFVELRKGTEHRSEEQGTLQALKEFSDGIDRSLGSLESMQRMFTEAVKELDKSLNTATGELQTYIGNLRRNEKLLNLKIELARSRASERFSAARSAATATGRKSFKVLKNAGVLLFRTVYRHSVRIYGTLTRVTRLDTRSSEKSAGSVEAYLKVARTALANLPAVYRRAFHSEPLANEKLLVGREKVLSTIKETYNEWHNGLNGMLAVIGERGSGRSTIARIARLRYFNDIPVLRIVPPGNIYTEESLSEFLSTALGFEKTGSLDTLEQQINGNESYRILIVEDIHYLFLRSISGLNTFSRFLLFATRTQEKLFWFFTCGEYTWRYLDKVLSLNRYISTVISLDGFSNDETENLIMLRHRLCGIPVRFIADHRTEKSGKYRQCTDDTERQAFLRHQFFRKLTEASTGNTSVAMLFWCISIRNRDNRHFEIANLPDLDMRIETAVSAEELFVITAIVLHERIMPGDLAAILSLPYEKALLLLTGLRNKGFIIESDGYYELHFFLYRSFIGYLHEKRLLH